MGTSVSAEAIDRADAEETVAEAVDGVASEVDAKVAGAAPPKRRTRAGTKARTGVKVKAKAKAEPKITTEAEDEADAPIGDAEDEADEDIEGGTDSKIGRATGGKNDREAQLIHQALALFSNGGYGETSLQEIADKLGITRPLFYYYFKSKDDLLWRLIGHVGDSLRDGARPIAASDADPVDKLRMLLEAHATALLENRDTFRIYFAERHLLEGKRHRTLKRGEDEYFGLIAQVIAEGQRTGEFRKSNRRVLAHLATGQINSLLTWFEHGGMMSANDLAELAAAVAVQGLLVASALESGQ